MTPHPGWRHSPETRRHLSAVNVGRRHSAETKQKISANNVGKHCREISAAQRAAVSAALKGQPFTLDHCDKISAALIA